MAKQQIAKTDKYTIEVDTDKNRYYLTAVGNWDSLANMSNYKSDVERGVGKLSHGFTIYSDVSNLEHMSEELVNFTVDLQKYLISKGIKKIASVGSKTMDTKKALYQSASTSGIERKSFHTGNAAEMWLDE